MLRGHGEDTERTWRGHAEDMGWATVGPHMVVRTCVMVNRERIVSMLLPACHERQLKLGVCEEGDNSAVCYRQDVSKLEIHCKSISYFQVTNLQKAIIYFLNFMRIYAPLRIKIISCRRRILKKHKHWQIYAETKKMNEIQTHFLDFNLP